MDPLPASRWRDHVVVCGLQGVGLRTVEQLGRAGVQVVVVDDDPDPRLVRVVEAWGVPYIVGSPRVAGTLDAAGLDAARAVVCAERTELQTLETALLVGERYPDIRVVVQLANAAVGAAVAQVTGPGTVLDVPSLAAPSIVEACLGRTAHRFVLGGTEFVAVEVEAERPGSLRALFGDLAPLAVVPKDGSDTIPCPGRDLRVGAGDRVTVLGTADELVALDLGADQAFDVDGSSGRRRPWTDRVRRMAGLASAEPYRALRWASFAALLLVAVSTVVLRFGYRRASGGRLTWLDAVYFTVETISTVGFGDFSFSTQPTALEAFGIVVIVAGVTLLTTVFALITNALVTWRIEQSLGRHRVVGMEGHVVVVGLGSVGIRVVEDLLAEGRQVVVVERNAENRHLNRARALGVPVLIADSTQRTTLESANLSSAAAAAVLTSDDLANIETALAMREVLGGRWEAVPVVLRVFDRALGGTVERHFGFRHVRSTSALAAPRFVGAALGLDIVGSLTVGGCPLLVGRLSVARSRGLDGLAMQDLSARTRVVAIRRAAGDGGLEHPPRRGTRFGPGDEAYLVGPYEELLRVLRRELEGDAGASVVAGSAAVEEG